MEENNHKILVVDNEELLLSLAKTFLERIGYSVETAGNGRIALEKLSANGNFDMVLSDVDMPEIGGIELVRRCREIYPQMPFLMVSGLSLYHEKELKELGVDCLQKPYRLPQLKEKIEQILNSKP